MFLKSTSPPSRRRRAGERWQQPRLPSGCSRFETWFLQRVLNHLRESPCVPNDESRAAFLNEICTREAVELSRNCFPVSADPACDLGVGRRRINDCDGSIPPWGNVACQPQELGVDAAAYGQSAELDHSLYRRASDPGQSTQGSRPNRLVLSQDFPE